MLDPKAMVLAGSTLAAASSSWLDLAEPIVALVMTLLVGSATLWYTIERAIKLRRERKDNEE